MNDEDLPSGFVAIDRPAAEAIVARALGRYVATRRGRVEPFVARHFSLFGSARLHRRALGWDLLRAPANVLLAVPQAAATLLGHAGVRAGPAWAQPAAGRLSRLSLLLETDVGREIAWLVTTEFLELPADDGRGRSRTRDAVAEAILADPAVLRNLSAVAAAVRARGGDPAFRAALAGKLRHYVDSRTAAADIVGALAALGSGGALFQQLTPGALSLLPLASQALAQQIAIAAFPLGAPLGGLWYGVFPATVPAGAVAAAGGGLVAVAALVATFAGIVADPVQRRLGLHQRRLNRLLDAMERDLAGDGPARFVLADPYVARLLDFTDLLAAALRATR